MPKPRKTTEEAFFDTFASWPVDDQAAALKVMTQLHRQAQRARQPVVDSLVKKYDQPTLEEQQ